MDDFWNVDGDRELSRLWTSFTQFSKVNAKPPKRIHVVRRETDKFRQHPGPIVMARNLVEHVEMQSKQRKTALGYLEAEARRCTEVERYFFTSIRMTWKLKTSRKMRPRRDQKHCSCSVNTDLVDGDNGLQQLFRRTLSAVSCMEGSPPHLLLCTPSRGGAAHLSTRF